MNFSVLVRMELFLSLLIFNLFIDANAELFRNYLKQIREETSGRLLSVAYRSNGTPNKWWLAFAKRKFMNIIALWNSIWYIGKNENMACWTLFTDQRQYNIVYKELIAYCNDTRILNHGRLYNRLISCTCIVTVFHEGLCLPNS